MSAFITAEELYEEAIAVLPSECTSDIDDFYNLANRALKRLHTKGANPYSIVEVDVTLDDTTGYSDRPVFILDTDLYDSVLSFRTKRGVFLIAPLVDLYNNKHYSYDRFIDMGVPDMMLGERVYMAPKHFKEDGPIKALAHRKYQKIVDEHDVLPFLGVGAPKNAMLAVAYEDSGDYNTAEAYWQLAVREMQEESSDYRGSSYPTFEFSGEKFTGMLDSIY